MAAIIAVVVILFDPLVDFDAKYFGHPSKMGFMYFKAYNFFPPFFATVSWVYHHEWQ